MLYLLFEHIRIFMILLNGFIVSVETTDNNETSVIDLRLTYVKVPEARTYYVCQQFEVKDDKPYHVTRFEPIINNTEIIHHMLVFGCEFEMDEKGPHPCDSLDYRCHTWLGKWDVGMDDLIMPENGGVRIGKGSFKYLLLQIHWNNEGASKDETDCSGMRLHATSNLRPYDVGNVQIGQNTIDIPGEASDVLISGTCSSKCTGLMLPRPIYITDVYLHMHGLGTRSALEVHRDREVNERIAYEDNYNYRKPIWHNLNPPVIINPGEPIEIKCWFDSEKGMRYRNKTTSFGQGTQAEMCYAFIRYYPRILGFDQCLQKGNKSLNC
ncbi:DBH-like monooxygenase protein 2 homolog [Mercenaria mercenaria]|uniref:DBH-like monooxygenase protein 2 homolog n=1 Tax=Mercenaria mercenaria TaxID=6596 RepID=UPI00234EC3E3|nr:DBH-like monooxygenase protein 2 homolog [Mercenaria mercenaria]